MTNPLSVWHVAEIRSRYTDSGNRCNPDIGKLAHIAIAHDVATLCGEIERLRNDIQELTCGDPSRVTNEHTGEEYLGKDRDELRAIIIERDIEIERLQRQLGDCELSLRVYDDGASEYWLRHPSDEPRESPSGRDHEKSVVARGETGGALRSQESALSNGLSQKSNAGLAEIERHLNETNPNIERRPDDPL